MATVYCRGRVWWVRYTRHGIEVRKSAKTKDRTIAVAYLQQLIEEQGRQDRGATPQRRVREVLDRFDAEHLPTLKIRSRERYRLAIKMLLPVLGDIPIEQLSRQHLIDFINARRNHGVSDSTIKRDLASLSSALTLAAGWGWAARNVVGLLDRRVLRSLRPRRRYLTHEEERRLLDAAVPHVRSLIIFAIETGLRREEQFSLRWDQVDFKRREVRLPITKNDEPRVVPLSDRALAVLQSHPATSPFVFVNSRTGNRYVEPKRGLNGAARRAGIKNLRWHDLRRTCGCRLIQDHDADLFHVSRWLGHKSVQVTERTYAFLRVQDLHGVIRSPGALGTNLGTVAPDHRGAEECLIVQSVEPGPSMSMEVRAGDHLGTNPGTADPDQKSQTRLLSGRRTRPSDILRNIARPSNRLARPRSTTKKPNRRSVRRS